MVDDLKAHAGDDRIPVNIYLRPHGRTHVEWITSEHATPEHFEAWKKYDEAGFSIGVEDMGMMHAVYFADKDTGYDAECLLLQDASKVVPSILETLLTFDVVAKRAYIERLSAEIEDDGDIDEEQGADPF